jgi:hypothetical protein
MDNNALFLDDVWGMQSLNSKNVRKCHLFRVCCCIVVDSKKHTSFKLPHLDSRSDRLEASQQ